VEGSKRRSLGHNGGHAPAPAPKNQERKRGGLSEGGETGGPALSRLQRQVARRLPRLTLCLHSVSPLDFRAGVGRRPRQHGQVGGRGVQDVKALLRGEGGVGAIKAERPGAGFRVGFVVVVGGTAERRATHPSTRAAGAAVWPPLALLAGGVMGLLIAGCLSRAAHSFGTRVGVDGDSPITITN